MNRYHLFLVLLTLCFSENLHSQELLTAGGRSGGMNTLGVNPNGLWSAYQNPAGMLDVQSWGAGVYFQDRFVLSELKTIGIGGVYRIKNGAAGAYFSRYGDVDIYAESQFGLSYALKLGESLNAGIRMNYNSIQLGGIYGKTNYLTVSGGFSYWLNEKMNLSGFIANPFNNYLNDPFINNAESLLAIGLRVDAGDKVIIQGEVIQYSYSNLSIAVGIEYSVKDDLFLRLGTGFNNYPISFGIGYTIKGCSLDASSSFHSQLGLSPVYSLSYENE